VSARVAVAVEPGVGSSRVLLALLSVWVIWGSTYLAMRWGVEELPPFLMGAARFLVAGGALLLLARARGIAWPGWSEWRRALLAGALLFLLGNGCVAFAEQRISSNAAAVACGTVPLWAAAFGPAFGERPSRAEWLGVLLGLLGVLALALGNEFRAEPGYAAILLVSPLAWSVGSLWSRRVGLAARPTAAATTMLAGGAWMLVVGLLLGERPLVPSPRAWLVLGYLTLFGSVVAFSAYTWLLGATRPALAMSYAYVNPLLAVLMGATLGQERVGPLTLLATGLVVGAVVVTVRARATTAARGPR
jgi:drug/metabolite transporter (DMT)-like permease